MATLTNTTTDELEIPLLGVVLSPGETRDLGDIDEDTASMLRGHGVLSAQGLGEPLSEEATSEEATSEEATSEEAGEPAGNATVTAEAGPPVANVQPVIPAASPVAQEVDALQALGFQVIAPAPTPTPAPEVAP